VKIFAVFGFIPKKVIPRTVKAALAVKKIQKAVLKCKFNWVLNSFSVRS